MSTERDNPWSEHDDTLADGPSPASVPDEAREWIAEQRLVHGLLRAMYTADASARESRVSSVLEGIDRHAVTAHRRHWVAVAFAASLLASIGIWFSLPLSLPTAEAAMARAVDELARDIDRQYHVQIEVVSGRRSGRASSEFDLITRPGMRFLIDGRLSLRGVRISDGRVGCDGETIWLEGRGGRNRRSGRLADRARMLAEFGDILDLGYLDLHGLVENLPSGFKMRVVDRFLGEDGEQQLLIKARRRSKDGAIRVRSAELVVDELSGMVKRLDAEVLVVGGGVRQVLVEYRGQPAPGSVDYSRPW